MNMFDLTSQRVGGASTRKKVSKNDKIIDSKMEKIPDQKYSDDEIKKMLEDYTEVAKEKWPDIKKNEHIRYRRIQQNLFRRGGFVINQWVNPETQKRMIQLISNPYAPHNSKNAPWTINYDDIQNIWVKNKQLSPRSDQTKETISSPSSNPKSEITSINKPNIDMNIEYIKHEFNKKIEAIHIELTRLSNEQKNIIALIKKLHKL